RFVGEPVAAVIAVNPRVAEEGVQLITAEYEELPPVFDEVEALTASVYVHDELRPAAAQKAGLTAVGPYDIDNVSIDSFALYTNVTPAGALRGFGVPQLVWAYESHTDMIARARSSSIQSSFDART